MPSPISSSLINKLKEDVNEIRSHLDIKGYIIPSIPNDLEAQGVTGETFSKAYPIQGILKYHGFYGDPDDRVAFFPSISLNNSCAYTASYLKLDDQLKEDCAYINGKQVFGTELERIQLALNYIRNLAKISPKSLLISRNIITSSDSSDIGKGLGTSAAGSAALAIAAASIVYDNKENIMKNKRFLSVLSRFLSGSGCRSSAGGFALWLSYPKIDPFNCFAIRLDREEHKSFIDDICLLTIPIQSPIKTLQAHTLAPTSPFFLSWLKQRKNLVLQFIEALDNHDLSTIGEIAEFDTLCLHSVTMTAPSERLIALDPDSLKIMKLVLGLRDNGNDVYFSIDTGPSVVLITKNKEKNKIIKELKSIVPKYNILEGAIAGSSTLIDSDSHEAKILKEDIDKFLKE